MSKTQDLGVKPKQWQPWRVFLESFAKQHIDDRILHCL